MLTLIAAVANNHCIGVDGRMPWHIPEDFVHFKRQTMGGVVLMGRKTWESLPPKFRPLPNRTNVVVTRREKGPLESFSGAEVYNSLETALAAHADDDIYVIGGAQLYAQTIARADRLIVTHVNRVVDGDAFFPEIGAQWNAVAREEHEGFAFVTYEKARVHMPKN